MYTTALHLDNVQQTLVKLYAKPPPHSTVEAQQWQLTYISAHIGPQPERSLIVLSLDELSNDDVSLSDVPICEFDISRRAVGWHRFVTREPSPPRLMQTARIFSRAEITETRLRDRCDDKLLDWVNRAAARLFIFVWLEPSVTSGLFAIGWLCPHASPQLFAYRFRDVKRQCLITSPASSTRCSSILLQYIMTRLHVCWSDTRVHVLCDMFVCASDSLGFFNL